MLDSRDVQNCFILFLGRMPAHAGPHAPDDGFDTSTIRALLGGILEDEEFQTSLLRPLLLRETLPHGRLDGGMPLGMIDWAQRTLPISAATRRALGGVRHWAQILELLLSDSELVAAAPHLVAAEVDQVLRTRLEEEPWARCKRSVIGVVDAASAFEINGWAVDLCDRSKPVLLEFYADTIFLGTVTCSESRPDVRDIVGGDGNFGYRFKISTAHRASFARGRTLFAIDSVTRDRVGVSTIVYDDAAQSWDAIGAARNELAQVRQILERIESRLPEIGRMASIPIEAYDEYWRRFYQLSPDVLCGQRERSQRFAYRPSISVVLPAWRSDTRFLEKAVGSVLAQSYDCWELVISDDASDRDEMRSSLRRYGGEPRIRWMESASREGIAANTNRAVAAARGEYVAFLDHDDELAPDALYQMVLALQERRYALLYSDEDRIEQQDFERTVHHTPFFKPDFDPDLLLAINYICHLVVVRRDLIAAIGGLRSGFEGAQDHDLLLRAMSSLAVEDIRHVPRILYHWRVTPGSVSATPALAGEIQKNITAVVQEHLEQLHLPAKVEAHEDPVGPSRQFANRVRWRLPSPAPKISIVIATRDRLDLLRPCIESVSNSIESYPGSAEILLVDNDSAEAATLAYFETLSGLPSVRLIRFRGPFNWSAINNAGAQAASGEVLIFLNNDTVVLTKEWCVELAAHTLREDVGAVGARLLYADGTIQHAGVLLGVEGVAGHEAVGDPTADGGYFGRTHLLRSAAAVTGACLATRRSLFLALDGFDEVNLKVAFNDVDFCMRVREAGYRIVYNPFAVLYHFESKSRGREISESQQVRHRAEAAAFRARWGAGEIADPYYNPHFERYARPFDRLRPPLGEPMT